MAGTLSPTRRVLHDTRARLLELIHPCDHLIRFKGSNNDHTNVRHYLSTWHLRHRVPYLGAVSAYDYLFELNHVSDEFLAFTGPRVYCAKEPPILLTAETLERRQQDGIQRCWYRYDDPDINRRMFYPSLDKNPQVVAQRLEATVTKQRPRRCCFINRWTDDFNRSLIQSRLLYLDVFGDDVDIYGGAPKSGENGWLAYRNYQGPVSDKQAVLQQYDFIIAFENSDFDGYITEKIVEALAAGAIPLYWGGGHYLAETIPADCFIDCRDQDPRAVHQRVMAMHFDEIIDFRQAGIRFLRSSAAQRFTRNYWTEGLLRIWREQTV